MKYVIGIDGGGTKTLLKIADCNGKLIKVMEGGPSNINSLGIEKVKNSLKDLVENAIIDICEIKENCLSFCIGSAGIDRQDERVMMEDIIRSFGITGRVKATNDAETALYGGVLGGEGVILISGTGSISFGRNNEGKTMRCGGWGHILGDEGSGYDIGRRALTSITRSYDGRENETILTSIILKKLDLKNPMELINYVYRSGAGKKEIASLARCVDEAYKKGDKTAERILRESAYELYLCITPIINGLGLKDKKIPLALNGSVLTKNEFVNTEFKKLVEEKFPHIDIINMREDAAWGAVLIALDSIKEHIK